MPPRPDSIPDCLRTFAAHGVTFPSTSSLEGQTEGEVVARCVWCGKDKLHIDLKTTKWSCFTCGDTGNNYTFLTRIHEESMSATSDEEYTELEASRGLTRDAMKAWGVCKNVITGDWIVPGYGGGGGIVNLYRYIRLVDKYRLLPTPGVDHGIFKPISETFPDSRERIDITEGPWDGIAWWWNLDQVQREKTCVVSVPGCHVFKPSWTRFTSGRIVTFLYDNDYPRRNELKSGTVITQHPAYDGMRNAAGVVSQVEVADQPKEVRFLCWSGKEDKAYNEKLPDGYDLRDYLRRSNNIAANMQEIEGLVKPVPKEWTEGKAIKRGANKGEAIKPLPCTSWKVLQAACRKAAKWTPELNGAMVVLLASVASVRGQGEQLWVRLISPPSTYKSKLAGMVSTAGSRYVVEDDGMNGFFSGYKDTKKGEEPKDFSLASRIYDKTLITKEGATLVNSPMKDVIISQGRTLYDGAASRSYNNGLRWEHYGLRFTWILCGTQSLRSLDSSELGQRFIDYVIMENVDTDMESEIMENALLKQLNASMTVSNCKMESTIDREYLHACQLCGGYVDYLRKNIETLVGTVSTDVGILKTIGKWATFVEYMRARPSITQEESSDRALGTRVGGQLLKLAQYIALVMQKKKVDKEVMAIVRKVAMDTAKGRTLEIIKSIDGSGTLGLDLRAISRRTRREGAKESRYLEFLVSIRALEMYEDDGPSLNKPARWRLTKEFSKLYRQVMVSK